VPASQPVPAVEGKIVVRRRRGKSGTGNTHTENSAWALIAVSATAAGRHSTDEWRLSHTHARRRRDECFALKKRGHTLTRMHAVTQYKYVYSKAKITRRAHRANSSSAKTHRRAHRILQKTQKINSPRKTQLSLTLNSRRPTTFTFSLFALSNVGRIWSPFTWPNAALILPPPPPFTKLNEVEGWGGGGKEEEEEMSKLRKEMTHTKRRQRRTQR
jgi:hypothetical protein